MKTCWLAVMLCLAPLEQAFSWGQEGHSIVAEIAQRRLSPASLQQINRLLGSELPGLEGAQFSLASVAITRSNTAANPTAACPLPVPQSHAS